MSGMLLWALVAGVGPVIDDVEMGTGGAVRQLGRGARGRCPIGIEVGELGADRLDRRLLVVRGAVDQVQAARGSSGVTGRVPLPNREPETVSGRTDNADVNEVEEGSQLSLGRDIEGGRSAVN
jgi:hypothetical protein